MYSELQNNHILINHNQVNNVKMHYMHDEDMYCVNKNVTQNNKTHTLQKYLPSRQNNLITNMSYSLMFVTVASYMKVEGFQML